MRRMKLLILILGFASLASAQAGLGKSTLTCLDVDGDGYGVGPGCIGPDADDGDATVQTAAQAIAKWGTLAAFLQHRGYSNTSRIWYLATVANGGNDSTCVINDVTHPCATWAHINTAMSGGDMVLARGGTWTNVKFYPPSGTSSNATVILAYPGELPIIDNTNTAAASGASIVIAYNSGPTTYVTIDGGKYIAGLGNSGCIGGGGAGTDHITIRYTETTNCADGGLDFFDGLSNFLIEYNVMHDFDVNVCGGCQHAMYIGGRTNPSSNITIRSNILYNSHNGYPTLQWNGRGTNVVIDGNIIYNGAQTTGMTIFNGLSSSFVRNNLIFNNGGAGGAGIFIANYDGDCYQGAGSGGICPYSQTNNLFENNTIVNMGTGPDGSVGNTPALYIENRSSGCPYIYSATQVYGAGWEVLYPYGLTGGTIWTANVGGTLSAPPSSDWTNTGTPCNLSKVGDLGTGNVYRNNIFVGFADPILVPMATMATGSLGYEEGLVAGSQEWSVLDTSDATLANSTFQNNLSWMIYQNGSNTVSTAPLVGPNWTTHTIAQLNAGTSCATHPCWNAASSGNVQGNPSFASYNNSYSSTPALFNFRLNSASPALGAGSAVGAPATDITGSQRPTPPSMGAYEGAGNIGTGVVLTSLSCSATTLSSGATASCTVTMSQSSGATGAVVALSSNNNGLTVPLTVSIPANASTANFTVTAGTVSSSQTASVTGSLNGSSATATLTLTAPTSIQVSSVSCAPTTLATAAASTCTVALTQAAGSAGATIALASNTSLLTVPATVAIPGGASTATFSALAGSIGSSQSATVTASLNGGSSAASISLATGGKSSSGWQSLSNTALISVCPPNNFNGISYPFTSMCPNVVNAWNGGIADTKRNRLIIWGGGHSDYSGNEIYAVNLGTAPPSIVRLTDPSAWNYSNSYEVNLDGTPTSRHTYNGLVYLPVQDALFSFSGVLPSGSSTSHTWLFTFADSKWHSQDPVNGFNPLTIASSITGAACAYDPNTQTVFCLDGNTNYLLQYAPATNTYTKLSITAAYPLAATAAIDPIRKLMVFMGNAADGTTFKVSAVDISGADPTYKVQDWTSQVSGCAGMNVDWPGFVYDSASGKFVGYPNQGGTVYLFDDGTKTCTPQTFANPPQTTSTSATYGTFGRFQYFPGLDTFVLVNDAFQNTYTLNLSSTTSPPPTASACDLNGDGVVNSLDVQIAISQALGITACGSAALTGNNQCNVVDVQRVINASLGMSCLVGQ